MSIHPSTHPPAHLTIYSSSYADTPPPAHSSIHPFTQQSTHSLTHPPTHLFTITSTHPCLPSTSTPIHPRTIQPHTRPSPCMHLLTHAVHVHACVGSRETARRDPTDRTPGPQGALRRPGASHVQTQRREARSASGTPTHPVLGRGQQPALPAKALGKRGLSPPVGFPASIPKSGRSQGLTRTRVSSQSGRGEGGAGGGVCVTMTSGTNTVKRPSSRGEGSAEECASR